MQGMTSAQRQAYSDSWRPRTVPPPPDTSLQDFLNGLFSDGGGGGGGSGGGGGGGGGFVAPPAYIDSAPLRARYSDSDARLGSLYNAASQSIAGSAGTIGQNFDTAIGGVNQAGEAATNQINQAYKGAQDSQSQQLAALGIGDALANIVNSGNTMQADQAGAISRVAETQSANAGDLSGNRGSALRYNTTMADATKQSGAEAQYNLLLDFNDQMRAIEEQNAAMSAQYQAARSQALSSRSGGGGGGRGGGGGGRDVGDTLNAVKTFYDYLNPDTALRSQNLAKLVNDQQQSRAEQAIAAQNSYTRLLGTLTGAGLRGDDLKNSLSSYWTYK